MAEADVVYPPKHNAAFVAEIEFSALSRQYLDRRITDLGMLAREVAAWEQERNAHATTVHCEFTRPQGCTFSRVGE